VAITETFIEIKMGLPTVYVWDVQNLRLGSQDFQLFKAIGSAV
jgi:hypothetical protein